MLNKKIETLQQEQTIFVVADMGETLAEAINQSNETFNTYDEALTEAGLMNSDLVTDSIIVLSITVNI